MIRRVRSGFAGLVVGLLVVLVVPAPARADSTRDAQWFLPFLKVAAAQRISTGVGVTVAVIDNGVDGSHPDLTGTVVAGTDFVKPGQNGQRVLLMAEPAGSAVLAPDGRVRDLAAISRMQATTERRWRP